MFAVKYKNRGFTQSGFTLIELLVIISIIGFLVSAAIFSLNNARAKARDARRQANITQLQKAVEMYIAEYEKPPITSNYGEANIGGWDSSSQGDFMQFLEGAVGSANSKNIQFMAETPKDPINNGSGDCGGGLLGYQYCYYYYSSPAWGIGPHYRIGAKLERTGTTYWSVNPI